MITRQQVSANLRSYYLASMDWIALILVAVIDRWTQHGLDLAEILLVQAIFGFTVMVLEYPSGVLADLTSRRKLIIFAYVANMLGIFTLLFADSFATFVLAEVLFGFAIASRSGANTAHIYDTYLEIDQQERAEEVLANGKSLRYANIMVMTAAGGILASIHWQIPLVIAILGNVIVIISYVKSYEPERIQIENSADMLKSSVRHLKKPEVLKVMLILFFLIIFLRISFWDYIPRLELLGVDSFWFGIVLAAANGIALLSSLLMRKYKQLVDYDLSFVAIGMLGLLMFLNQNNLIIVLMAIFFHQVYRGAGNLIFEIRLNRQVDSSIRAGITSMISAIGQGSYFILIGIMNLLDLSSLEIHQLNSVMGAVTSVIIIFLTLIIQIRSRNEEKTNFHSDPIEIEDQFENIPIGEPLISD